MDTVIQGDSKEDKVRTHLPSDVKKPDTSSNILDKEKNQLHDDGNNKKDDFTEVNNDAQFEPVAGQEFANGASDRKKKSSEDALEDTGPSSHSRRTSPAAGGCGKLFTCRLLHCKCPKCTPCSHCVIL